MTTSIIVVEDLVLPTNFVFDEIRQLSSDTGCRATFNQSDNDICRICCD